MKLLRQITHNRALCQVIAIKLWDLFVNQQILLVIALLRQLLICAIVHLIITTTMLRTDVVGHWLVMIKLWCLSPLFIVPLLLINETCSGTYQCKTSGYLSCVNNMCVCPTVGTGVWFWSPANVVCIQCPAGWTVYFGHCYYVNITPKSWSNALAWCLSQGADLMEVRNQNEYNLLYNFYDTQYFC